MPLASSGVSVHTQALGAFQQRGKRLVKGEDDGLLAALCRGDGITQGDGGFPATGGTDEQCAGAGIDASAEQLIQPLQPAGHGLALEARLVLGRNQPRIDGDAAGLDGVVVKALADTRIRAACAPPPGGA